MDELRGQRHMTVTDETVTEIGDANDKSEKNHFLRATKLKEQISPSWTRSALNRRLNFLFSQS